MKEIKLTKGFSTKVDDDDYEYLNQWKWHALVHATNIYAARSVYTNKKNKMIYMHREIMHPTLQEEVDHIDHNCLNNQKSNLRNCTRQQNQRNKRARKNSSSKYLGVCHKYIECIVAQIRANNKTIFLGYFNTEEDAARAYDKAAKEYHGEFANLNFKD